MLPPDLSCSSIVKPFELPKPGTVGGVKNNILASFIPAVMPKSCPTISSTFTPFLSSHGFNLKNKSAKLLPLPFIILIPVTSPVCIMTGILWAMLFTIVATARDFSNEEPGGRLISAITVPWSSLGTKPLGVVSMQNTSRATKQTTTTGTIQRLLLKKMIVPRYLFFIVSNAVLKPA